MVPAIPARHKDQLAINDVKWSHGDYAHIIATAAANGRVVVYDLNRAGVELARFHEHNRQVHKLAFSPFQGAWLLSGSQDESIRMWDLRTVSSERSAVNFGSKFKFDGHNDAVRDVRWSPVDGVEFAAATDSGVIQHWDVRKHNAPLLKINAHDKTCFCVDWHPDGKHILSGGADKLVKIWDFSTGNRKQKPCFQLRTPQAAVNVRWRPASATDSQGTTSWETTQFATGHDSDDPRVHIWDIRRPHLPFRQFYRHGREPSDLLWHSNDLLWTVGQEGTFNQSDIRFAPQVIDQRRPCTVAWSPNGEVLAFGQGRPRRRGIKKSFGVTEFIPSPKPSAQKTSFSASITEENTNDTFSQYSGKKRSNKPIQGRSSNSKLLGNTPEDGPPTVVPLTTTVSKTETVAASTQNGLIGSIQGATSDPAIFKYLAKNYSKLLEPTNHRTAECNALTKLCEQLDNNAMHTENIPSYRLAQTWRIIRDLVEKQVSVRPRLGLNEKPQGRRRFSVDESEDVVAQREKEKHLPSIAEVNSNNRDQAVLDQEVEKATASKAAMEVTPNAETVKPQLSSASSRPIQNSLLSYQARSLQASLTRRSTTDLTLHTGSNNLSEVKTSACQIIDEESISPRSFSPEPAPLRRDFLSEDIIGQRSAPRNISGRPDWHGSGAAGNDAHEGEVDSDKLSLAESPNLAKMMLSRSANSQSSKLYKTTTMHDSSESFRLFSTSTDSSMPAKSVAGSYSPGNNLREEIEGLPIRGGSLTSMRNNSHFDDPLAIGSPPKSERQDTLPTESSLYEESTAPPPNTAHLIRPSSPLPFLYESVTKSRLRSSLTECIISLERQNRAMLGPSEEGGSAEFLVRPETEDQPWSVQNLLKQAIMHYCSTSPVDIQSAAHLLHKLHTVFPPTEEFFPYQQRDFIFRAYNELLLRQQMFTTAVELRLLCVRAYPSVYDYAQKETFINVYCFTCKKPFENPVRDNTRCHRCQATQLPCTICESLEPPREWVETYAAFENPPDSDDDIITQPHGSALWSWCQGCGHGAHTACQVAWLGEVELSEGGCPTPGCMHDCGFGQRRENYRTYQKNKKRASGTGDSAAKAGPFGFTRRDSWAKGESKAVERVRRVLGVGAGFGQQQFVDRDGDGAPGALKKVRVMAPER